MTTITGHRGRHARPYRLAATLRSLGLACLLIAGTAGYVVAVLYHG